MTEYEKFGFAVDLLVEANESFRKRSDVVDIFKHLPLTTYGSEMATVRVHSNCRAGKTAYVNSRATSDDLVVTGTYSLSRLYQGPACVWIADPLRPLPVRRFNKIYVDEPCYVFGRLALHRFYEELCKDADQTFIFLGRI